jgi:hypothetical protein
VLLVSACGSSSSGRQSHRPTPLPGIVDCGVGPAKIKPSHLLTTCSDGDFHITGIRWSTWGHRHAAGKGTGHLECGSSCVAGDPEVFPIRLELSLPEACGQDSAPQFTLLALRIIGPKPTHTGRTLSYHSNCPLP